MVYTKWFRGTRGKMKIAGIVLYNPSIERLKMNIESIYLQVDKVVLINNGSSNRNAIYDIISLFSNIEIIDNDSNKGIAKALNQIAEYAITNGAEWVLTLDQDSICDKDLISNYEQHTLLPDVASITCRINDRNINLEKNIMNSSEFVDSCITSANYIRLSVWNELGGFDERLFIDKVDTDYSFRLIHQGYKILKISKIGILHEIGINSKEHSFLGKHFFVYNHPAFRCYYMIRNQIYFARKHCKLLGSAKSLRIQRTAWTRIFVILAFESDKIAKMKAWYKGLGDGYSMNID